MKKYGYMIKTVNKDMREFKYQLIYPEFKYPEKGKVVAPNWDPHPEKGGGIHGLIHETRNHYIESSEIWLILKYEKGTEVTVYDEEIKVPYAWVVFVGTAQEAQKKFKELTGKEYQYGHAIQITEKRNCYQKGEEMSFQKAGSESTQVAGNWSIQIGEYYKNTQIVGKESIQIAKDESKQIAEKGSIQIARINSFQSAEEGSISIIDGKEGYCQHKGKVLQILRFYDDKKDEYVFLYTIIKNNKRYKLKAIETTKGWKLEKKEVKENE